MKQAVVLMIVALQLTVFCTNGGNKQEIFIWSTEDQRKKSRTSRLPVAGRLGKDDGKEYQADLIISSLQISEEYR
ncbi:MAG: hypothetical protein U0Y68_06195 [Blastocatellia bacterium]